MWWIALCQLGYTDNYISESLLLYGLVRAGSNRFCLKFRGWNLLNNNKIIETITIIVTHTDNTNKDADKGIGCLNNPVDLIDKVIIYVISTFYERYQGSQWILLLKITCLPSRSSQLLYSLYQLLVHPGFYRNSWHVKIHLGKYKR